jgi:hypothetical protein
MKFSMPARVLASSCLLLVACGDSGSSTGGSSNGASDPGGSGQGAQGVGGATDGGGGSTITGFGGEGGSAVVCDPACEPGTVCENGTCVPGCNADAPCGADTQCCDNACIDPQNDALHCGGCDPCPNIPNVAETCTGGFCGIGDCDAGFANCDGDASNGCETVGACLCTPGAMQSCYNGPANTEGVGICTAGTQICNANGLSWGICTGQVFPETEVCADGIDNDCNNLIDEDVDADGDGWGVCSGDCCDSVGPGCGNPELVNPGAFEFPGNMVEDDCNMNTPDTGLPTNCSTVAKFSGVTAFDVLNAMDLCQVASGDSWGIVSASFVQANGSAPIAAQLTNMQNFGAAIMTQYGTDASNLPQLNATFAGISSGRMRDQNDAGYIAPNTGTAFNYDSTPPGGYLAAHGGALPSSAGCSGNCPAGDGANDSINVRAQIKVPTNAQSLSYKFRFFSSEYWTYSCTQFNDFYLALLTSGAPGIPADKNISFDSANNPVSVNNGFFDSCAVKGCYTCPLGTGPLAGTGMQVSNTGGATSWLTTTAPVVPGETITLELMVFDVSDNILDTNVLLDALQFSVMPSGVGTTD